ncbi:MAG: hypothetical protein CMJ75_22015 [Planctomycetaceae bacterium]|nr:hypothetical protein [Planctomycetaceae bacterium]
MVVRKFQVAVLVVLSLLATTQVAPAANPGRLGTLLRTLLSGRQQPSEKSDSGPTDSQSQPKATVLERGTLAKHALAAGRDFQPKTARDVAVAIEQVQMAMQSLEQFLATNDDTSTDWKMHLRWEDAIKLLAQEKPPELRSLRDILQCYRQNIPGIERKPFTKVRDKLEILSNTVLYSNAQITKVYQQRVKQLADQLMTYSETSNADDGFLIGRLSGFLQQGGQADSLVTSIRHHYSHPNLMLSVSQDLIGRLLSQRVEDTMPLEDRINGTTLRGTVHTVGTVTVELVDNPSRGNLRVRLRGNAESKSIGSNLGVTVHTTGNTKINASKLIHLDAFGLHPQPASANCVTESSIDSISARSRCIEKIAWRRALASQSQGEQMASRRAEQQVAERVDQQTTEMLKEANHFLKEQFRQPLIRRNAFPRLFEFTTIDGHLKLRMQQSNSRQLAAPGPAPQHEGTPDVGIKIHESLIGNLSEAILGGTVLTGDSLQGLLEDLGAEVPAELQGDAGEPWSITFSSNRPIRVSFQDNITSISLRGRRFTRGDTVVGNVIDITARYSVNMTPAGLKLKRQGDVEVDYVNRRTLGVPQIAIKTMLLKKFNSLYKPELEVQDLVLPERWRQAGNLRLKNSQVSTGWLVLNWIRQPGTKTDAKVAQKP